MGSSQQATTYPTEEQYERWKNRADELDMGVSEFMQAMIEAGMKKFDTEIDPDETRHELREQRNDLKEELEHARDRIANLEEELYSGERASIENYIEENPGVTFNDVVQHVIDTTPSRVNQHLEALEGESIQVEVGEYYPKDYTTQGGDTDGTE